MRRRIEQLRALSLYEWSLMMAAILLLPVIGLLLRLLGFKRTESLLRRMRTAEKDRDIAAITAQDQARVVARMISVAARHGPCRHGCLRKSLLAWWMLALHGISSEIRFGVEKKPTEYFSAHAWVACGQVNISDGEESQLRYLAFEEFRHVACQEA